MPHFKTSRRVAVPPHVAFAVASDVAAYSAFLPLLESAVIRGAVTESEGIKQFSAELVIGYAKLGLRERLLSEVICDQPKLTVTATSKDPPFKTMQTQWVITPAQNMSDVSITIDYAMRNPLLQFAIAGAMDMAVNKVLAAFEARALSVHRASPTS
jgi:coenzyme Q-binding protein COQ10